MSKVSEVSHNLLISTAQTLLENLPLKDVKLSDVYRAAGVSKATAYRDDAFRSWWQEQARQHIDGRYEWLENELAAVRSRVKLLQEEKAKLEKENILARTVVAAQIEQIQSLTLRSGKILSLSSKR